MPAIKDALGVSLGTVHADVQAFSSERVDSPSRVIGTDGKEYASARPQPAPPAPPFIPPQPVMSPEEAEERRQRRVATDLLTDLVNSLSLLAGSDETFERYTPEIAHPWPINAEMLDKADTALRKTRTTLTRKGIL